MADITIKFINTNQDKEITVTLDDSFTANEIIAELYMNKFIEPTKKEYYLKSQKGVIIDKKRSLKDLNIKTNDFIFVSTYSSDEGKMTNTKQEQQKPLIFISHHKKDAKLANLFANLLTGVSQNLIKTFCSSSYDIKYGTNPYDQITERINEASDVICILTKNSIDKPWILYEAGLGKAKVDVKVFGVAFGVSLNKINKSGPFFLFQNCRGLKKDLCELIKQLLARTLNIEKPDGLMIETAVDKLFFSKLPECLKNTDIDDDISHERIYKEIKNISDNLLDNCKINSHNLNDFINHTFKLSGDWGFIFLLNLLKVKYPWLYDIGFEIIKDRSRLEEDELVKLISHFKNLAKFSIDKDLYDRIVSKEKDFLLILTQTVNRISINDNKMISIE